MTSSMKIREAREDELDALITKAEEHLPNSLTIHGLLSIGFRRNIFNRDYSKIYIPVNENLPFFIIITGVIIKNKSNMTAFWNPEEISTEVAREYLLSIPGFNFEKPFIIYCTWTSTLKEIEKIVMGENGISNNKLSLACSNIGFCYILDMDVFSTTIPESDFLLAPLTVKDAELVHKNWIYYYAEDTESIRRNLECLPSVAAYDKTVSLDSEINVNVINEQMDTENKRKSFTHKPISWALTRPYGEIGFNFTFPEYRNKGLSGIVTKELAKKLLEEGIKPFVNVTGQNIAAIKAIEKIGFRKYSPIGYHVYVYKGKQFSDF